MRGDLLYPDLSYKLIGILFEVSSALGHRYQERYYQRAAAKFFREAGINFKEQVGINTMIKDSLITKGFIDFLIEDKVILELKKGERFLKQNIEQVYGYLKATGLELGIIANFTPHGLQFKRIVNIRN